MAKLPSKFRRLCRAIFNRWTLTILTLLLFLNATGLIWYPRPLRDVNGGRFIIRLHGIATPGDEPYLGLWFSSRPMGADYWMLDNNDTLKVAPSLILPGVSTGAFNGATKMMVYIPLVPIILLMSIVAAYLHGRSRGRGRFVPGGCRKCGYPLDSLAENVGRSKTTTCPECGALNAKV